MCTGMHACVYVCLLSPVISHVNFSKKRTRTTHRISSGSSHSSPSFSVSKSLLSESSSSDYICYFRFPKYLGKIGRDRRYWGKEGLSLLYQTSEYSSFY